MRRAAAALLSLCLLIFFPMTAYASVGEDEDEDSGLIGGILDGLKDLFIPDEEFFEDYNDDIRAAIDRKTGGLATTFDNIMDSFNNLDGGDVNESLTLTLPNNHFYPGYRGTSVNVLQGIGDFATWFRGLFSAFMVVVTIIYCYRKMIALFKG